jgi:SOS-response transcriptional repressor LexA
MLTKRQAECFYLIRERIAHDGCAPSIRELCELMGTKSKDGVTNFLCALEEQKYIRRPPARHRNIQIIDHPENRVATPEGT